jgi:hypothetical protein
MRGISIDQPADLSYFREVLTILKKKPAEFAAFLPILSTTCGKASVIWWME